MPRREDDDVAARPVALDRRTLTLAGGFALAVAATLAVFLTDNPQFLRVAVVAVAWAFVLATFAAGRRGSDRAAAAAREADLRRAYEFELEREVAARREYELGLENELRRETEDVMRYELDALRGDIAALSGLRDEVAQVSALRGDIAALSALRDDVARVAALGDDVAALNSLRLELGQLADLRADMGRLRAELTEQLSSEMLVERIIMRTQASRLPGEATRLDAGPARALDGSASWADDVPPRELTGGWPAVRLDEPRETQQFEQLRVDRTDSRPPVPAAEPAPSWRTGGWEPTPAEPRPWDAPLTPSTCAPPTSAFASPAPPPPAYPSPGTSFFGSPVPPPAFTSPAPPPAFTAEDRWSPRPPVAESSAPLSRPWWESDRPAASSAADEPGTAAPRSSRHAADEPADAFPAGGYAPAEPPPPPPLDWLAARSLLDAPSAPRVEQAPQSWLPEVPPRRRRTDDDTPGIDPASAPATERPIAPPPATMPGDHGFRDQRPAGPGPAERPAESPRTTDRLAEILAENGVSPSGGGRRRRRYREDGESDDVLARVLGRS
jgi:hypothetical protein